MVIISGMSYKALYLTYRPQTFEEVAGQQAIVRTIRNSLRSGRIAHAYLFAGPRGTGKTTMARLLAKALNCEERLGAQCGVCQNCIDISEGNHPDVIEIDAASNNGVDQVRDLIERVSYAPIRARYKVYIIDEVHMMSAGAFNALLKTLEEPPENVIFILATTEPHKVLPTIISRCQRFDFTRVDNLDMDRKIKEVLGKEGANYDQAAVDEVISLADGGMRDALSILDQALAYSGGNLIEQDVLEIYGLISKREKIHLLTALARGSAEELLTLTADFRDGGVDIRRLNEDLITILKDLLTYINTGNAKLLKTLNGDEAETLSSLIDRETAKRYVESLLKNNLDFRSSSSVSSLFEISLLCLLKDDGAKKVVSPKVEEPIKEEPKPVEPAPIQEIKKEEPKVEEPEPEPIKVEEPLPEAPKKVEVKITPRRSEDPTPNFLFDEEDKVEEKPAPKPVSTKLDLPIVSEGEKYEIGDDEIMKILVLGDKDERTALASKWGSLRSLAMNPGTEKAASLLEQGSPYCLCKEAILISYRFKNLKEKTNIKANQTSLRKLMKELLGREVFVYAIDNIDQNRIINEFRNLLQVKKLPSRKGLTLNLPE